MLGLQSRGSFQLRLSEEEGQASEVVSEYIGEEEVEDVILTTMVEPSKDVKDLTIVGQLDWVLTGTMHVPKLRRNLISLSIFLLVQLQVQDPRWSAKILERSAHSLERGATKRNP